MREEDENALEDNRRSFYTPTKSVRINFIQYNDPCTSRNTVTGILGDTFNQPKKSKNKIAEPTSIRKEPHSS